MEWILEQRLPFDSLYFMEAIDPSTSAMPYSTGWLFGHLLPMECPQGNALKIE